MSLVLRTGTFCEVAVAGAHQVVLRRVGRVVRGRYRRGDVAIALVGQGGLVVVVVEAAVAADGGVAAV